MAQSFPKSARITKKMDFNRVFENGKIFRNNYATAYILCNDIGISRLGIIANKKLGNAVKRNRVKRLFREAFRINKDMLTCCVDIVILPQPNSKGFTFNLTEQYLKWLFKEIEDENLDS